MKIKRIKKLKVNSYLFDVIYEGMSGYGHVSYTDHQIINKEQEMSEIKTKLTELKEADFYTAKGDEYVITEDHSIADVLRHLISEAGGDADDIKYILNTIGEQK